MTTPIKPWEHNTLQNVNQLRNSTSISQMPQMSAHLAPALPPRPANALMSSGTYNSYLPYSSMGSYGGGYSGYNSYGSYGSYGMPYRNPYYNSSYGSGYNNFGMYGSSSLNPYSYDDSERRFIQYAEESSRNTFANVESIVRAFSSMAMMLDNTFFAMTSSFRAVLSVAENFGRLKNMFGHIWYSVNIFRFFNWLYRKIRQKFGYKVVGSGSSLAWKEAVYDGVATPPASSSNWPTLAFLGVLVSAPYIISKFLPKYEDKSDPANWQTPGLKAKAVFDFIATSNNELTIQKNDIITLAPTYVQEDMKLKNTGWAFAVLNGRSGVVPLNYIVVSTGRPLVKSFDKKGMNNNNDEEAVSSNSAKTHTKRVSFGENQIFENIDLDDYVKKPEKESNVKNSTQTVLKSSLVNSSTNSTVNIVNTQNSDESKE